MVGTSGGTGATGGAGGATGGTGGTAGTAGGMTATGTGEFQSSATGCDGAMPTDISALSMTPCEMCADAVCINEALAGGMGMGVTLAPCPMAGTVCVPKAYVAYLGMFKLANCTSLVGAEGRCVSDCVPDIAARGDRLPQDVCVMGEKCAPCFDPVSGMDTGACSQGCTDPPDPAKKVVFDKCCMGTGSCVPPDVAGMDAAQLAVDTCTEPGYLCAPDSVAGGKPPVKCTSVLGNEGRCQSTCLTKIAEQKDTLPKDVCADLEVCAPCFDPRDGMDTGACSVNGDMPDPTAEVKTFAPCCMGGGKCVPTMTVPEKNRMSLTQQDCEADFLCTPAAALSDPMGGAFADGAECKTMLSGLGVLVGNQPGRCGNACFKPAPTAGSDLLMSTCASGEVCLPCINPTTMMPTGACPP